MSFGLCAVCRDRGSNPVARQPGDVRITCDACGRLAGTHQLWFFDEMRPLDVPAEPRVSAPIKVFTFDYETTSIRETECEEFGYPHETKSGETMYENTHFRTRKEALAKLLSETKAGLSLATRERRDVRIRLERLDREVADAAERLLKVEAMVREQEREEARAS